jgi:hypothetical protein
MAAIDIIDSDHSPGSKGPAGTLYIFQFLEPMQCVSTIVGLLLEKIIPLPQEAVRSL